jgi:hypothetical protein
MEFPITRERLRNYMNGEAQEREIAKRVNETVGIICKEIEQTVIFKNEKKCVFELRGKRAYGLIFSPLQLGNNGIGLPSDGLLPQVIDALKEKCIGCDIVVDPLKTYILIDWS